MSERDGGTSILEGVGHKLQSLEERLQAANESHDRMGIVYGRAAALAAGSSALPGGHGLPGSSGSGTGREAVSAATAARQTPHLPALESTPNRPKMILPVISRPPATETETDKKLKKIMKQTGILTINGHQYKTDIADLEHLGDLGNGTSGNVVKMRHVPSGTIIAVKQMRRTGNTEENKRILMDLDVVLKSHDCKYIVQCLGCFVRDPDVWICMELMSMCFDKVLKLSKKPVPEPILGKVTVATVKALSYLKEKHNVIHRDVKPSNILIDERGNIKLCDFGISGRLVDSKANTRSAGCAAYMAPERIDPNKPEYDIRADVWSLGIALVELATARSPYEGCNTDFEVLTKVLDSEPPSLPYGDGFNFTHEFRDFVNKCLTKNHQFRPKYPELLEQPFIKYYETANVDVPKWFRSIVEAVGIRTHHRTFMPTTLSSTSKPNRNGTITLIATTTTTTPATTNSMTINTKPTTAAIAAAGTQIPSYQLYSTHRYKRDDYSIPQQQQQQLQQQQYHQPSQLPQPIANYYSNSSTATHTNNGTAIATSTAPTAAAATTTIYNQLHRHRDVFERDMDRMMHDETVSAVGVGGTGGASGSGSSSATSSSPQSPPQLIRDDAHVAGELNKLYRKSPFMQRKYSNGGSFKYGGESPKKESMFSSIGQSIIRNLTTSPFSQKKHTHTHPHTHTQPQTQTQPQPNQIDPLWRMPTTQHVAVAFDACDMAVSNAKYKNLSGSPVFDRKGFQNTTLANTTTTTATILQQQQQQQQSSLIPINRNESNPQRVQGNQSPIVLQRFYHQQNQLREKELDKQHNQQQPPQQHLYGRHSPENLNPFLSNYTPATNSHSLQNHRQHQMQQPQHQHQQQQSYIPIATQCHGTTTSATYSTSSQSSSTPSSACSQIAAFEQQLQFEQKQQEQQQPHQQRGVPHASAALPASVATNNLTGGFGIGSGPGAGQLQYQPLPQQYVPPLHSLRSSRSPPTSPPDSLSDATIGGSKLGKLYARRQLQVSSANSCLSNSNSNSSGSNTSGSASKENNYKDEQVPNATPTGTGSVSSGVTPATLAPTYTVKGGIVSANANGKELGDSKAFAASSRTPLPLYQRLPSAGSSSNTSNSTSPTELPRCRAANDFVDAGHMGTSNGSFLRRYAAIASGSGGAGSAYAAAQGNAHFLAGLDRRHRSPDPPPRYNRGQSPLLLRKNLLELSGQPVGSPLMNRRFVTASPPLPPPRRGSESVPGSPQHFRTRIHYTPEPQRRIYRTIDQ